MFKRFVTLLVYLVGAVGCFAQAGPASYTVQTLAGSAPAGDGGPADSAVLRFPNALAFDASGNLYIADAGNSSVRLVNAGGIISTLAGNGTSGFSGDGGPATSAQLGGTINGLALDAMGNVFVADSANHRIRVIAKDGTINTAIAASNLPGSSAASFWPNGLAFDNRGNLYIADGHNSVVYLMGTDGTVTVFAGTGKAGDSGDEGPATAAALNNPFGVFADSTGAVYIVDMASSRVRKVTPDGTIHAFAGTGQPGSAGDGGPALQAQLGQPMHLAADKAGNLYVTDHAAASQNVRMIAMDGTISTFAGGLNPNGLMGGDGGPASMALIQQAGGIAVSPKGDVFFSDSDSSVRTVSQGTIYTAVGYRHFAGELKAASLALLATPGSVAIDIAGNIFLADTGNFRVRQIGTLGFKQQNRRRTITIQVPNEIFTIAGTGQCGVTGDGGPSASASITRPLSVAADLAQNLYIGFNGRVRMITPGGIITTIAGGGTGTGDGIAATSASIGRITGIAVNAAGTIYLTESDRNDIRKITPDGMIWTIAGTGTAGNLGDGGQATLAQLNGPSNLAVDNAGNVYVTDTGNSRVRMIRPDGMIVNFAGSGQPGTSGDGAAATAAMLTSPNGIVIDNRNTIYISDSSAGLVRTVTPDGIIHTIAGLGPDASNAGFAGDGGLALSAEFNSPGALAVDPAGKVYVLDRQNERLRVLTPMSH